MCQCVTFRLVKMNNRKLFSDWCVDFATTSLTALCGVDTAPVLDKLLEVELGLDDKVEYKLVPLRGPPHPPPSPEREEYRKKVHPHSTVPALEVEGRPTMLESSAICMYLADLCGRLAPEPKDRLEYYDWIQYASERLDGTLDTLTAQWWFGPPEQQDKQVITKAMATASTCLDKLEDTLENRSFLLGQGLTAADCVVGYSLYWASLPEMNDGVLLKGRPNIQAYLQRLLARPALQATLALPGQD